MKKYVHIESFKDWNKVTDYESDDQSVILFDNKGKKLAEIGYGGFTKADLERFKNSPDQAL
jgi:hypothetical protein